MPDGPLPASPSARRVSRLLTQRRGDSASDPDSVAVAACTATEVATAEHGAVRHAAHGTVAEAQGLQEQAPAAPPRSEARLLGGRLVDVEQCLLRQLLVST